MADKAVNYTCPNCTAPLNFSPGQQKVVCEYCNTTYDVQTIEDLYAKKEESAVKASQTSDAKWQTNETRTKWSQEELSILKSFHCSSCGAEIVCDENTMATQCCYCGNPTMIPQRFEGMLRPDYIIPFKKTKKEALLALKNFYKGKYLLPSAFIDNNKMEEIQAMYVPFWLFDSKVSANASFEAKRIVSYSTKTENVTETSVYQCERSGNMAFEKIPVDGSKKMNDRYMESIEPFNYSEMEEFSNAYLTGFLADKYDVNAQVCEENADRRIYTSAVDLLRETVIGYNTCSTIRSNVVKTYGSVKYAMAPVWILTTRYQNKPYTFMMNGQTGKFVGSLPVDKRKAILYPAIVFIICCPILYFLIRYFL